MDGHVVDHLSRIVKKWDENPVREHFFDGYLFKLDLYTPWFANIVDYIVIGKLPFQFSYNKKWKLKSKSKHYVWEFHWKIRIDQFVRICVAENEHESILSICHERACRGYFGLKCTARKTLDFRF